MSAQIPPVARAKLFMRGRSQAVRLPKAFRFEGSEVVGRRVGDDVVLSSRPKASMHALVEALNMFEPAFVMTRNRPPQRDLREPMLAAD